MKRMGGFLDPSEDPPSEIQLLAHADLHSLGDQEPLKFFQKRPIVTI